LQDREGIINTNTKSVSINDITYSRDSKPFGKTWEEWTAKWWQWLISIPLESNPGIDATGEKFDVNQNDPHVVFLVGTFGGSAERNYTIPAGKSVLFPIINFTTSYIEEPALKTESELKSRAKQDIDDIVNKDVTVDDMELQNVEKYRVQSPVFDLTYPKSNVFGLPSGPTRAISDGYWVFLKPLSPGMHDIYAAGSCSSGKTKVECMWHLNVKD
jgi:hypothetical protein